MGHKQPQVLGALGLGKLPDLFQRLLSQPLAAKLHRHAQPVHIPGGGGFFLPGHVPFPVVMVRQGKGPSQGVPGQKQVKLPGLDILPHHVPGISIAPNVPPLPVHAGHQGGVHLLYSGQVGTLCPAHLQLHGYPSPILCFPTPSPVPGVRVWAAGAFDPAGGRLPPAL